jgi:hypothetical protein
MATVNRGRRWPTSQEVIERTKRGLIDETSLSVSLFDLDESELLGEPAPEPSIAKGTEPAGKKRKSAR